MALLVFPGPKSEEDVLKERIKELTELYRQTQEIMDQTIALLEYHESTGFQYVDADRIMEHLNKNRITERPVAHKISSYAEIEE